MTRQTSTALIPPESVGKWQLLANLLAEVGPVPCQTSDPGAWWPKRNDDLPTRIALNACSSCDARRACLEYALAAGEEGGIWGGTLPEERRKLRRQPT